MPIYEYRCSSCDRVFEALQGVHDDPLDACRHCGGPARRLISSPAIRFVGSGWYVNDYAKKGQARKDGARKEKAQSSGDGKAGKDAKRPAAAKDGGAKDARQSTSAAAGASS